MKYQSIRQQYSLYEQKSGIKFDYIQKKTHYEDYSLPHALNNKL